MVYSEQDQKHILLAFEYFYVTQIIISLERDLPEVDDVSHQRP